jgi:hypothetical protein
MALRSAGICQPLAVGGGELLPLYAKIWNRAVAATMAIHSNRCLPLVVSGWVVERNAFVRPRPCLRARAHVCPVSLRLP